jgi:hypothetical protein
LQQCEVYNAIILGLSIPGSRIPADFGIVKSRDLNFGIFGIILIPGFAYRDPGFSGIKQLVIRNLQVVTCNFPVVKIRCRIVVRINIANIIYKKFRNQILIIVSCFEKSIRTPVTPLRHSAHH